MEDGYESVVAVLRYIKKYPGQTMTQIMTGLEGKITSEEFVFAEEILTNLAAIKSEWGTTRDGAGYVYRPCTPSSLRTLKPVLRQMLSRNTIRPSATS